MDMDTASAIAAAIASLPYGLTSAYQGFVDAVADLPNQTSIAKALEALEIFGDAIKEYPALSAELDRRAAFIENECGDGSLWKQTDEKVKAILSKPLELDTNEPDVVIRLRAEIAAISLLQIGVGCADQLQRVIDALKVALKSKGLTNPAISTLRDFKRLSEDAYKKAVSLQADGCGTLKHAYEDLDVNDNAQSGTLEVLRMVPESFQALSKAADSLILWSCEHLVTPQVAGAVGGNSTIDEANTVAMALAKKDAAFVNGGAREWAAAIRKETGKTCSVATVKDTPLWIKTMEVTGRGRSKGKTPSAVSLTGNMEAVVGKGGRHEVLKSLIAQQQTDYEPSPFDDPPGQKVRARKRV
jgi:hypothetical protein